MSAAHAPLEIVETLYRDLDADGGVWLDDLRDVAARALPDARWLTAAEVHASRGALTTSRLAADEERQKSYTAWHGAATPALLDAIYLRGPVNRLAPLVAGTPWVEALAAQGVRDVVGAVGLDPGGRGIVISYGTRERSLSRARRVLLGRLAAHLAAAARLRAPRGTPDIEAVCDARGHVSDAVGEARGVDARTALRDAALRIDRARTRGARIGEDERLAMWSALVEGRWSLVERFESDGRRIFVAQRNAPTGHRDGALTGEERAIVALAAVGRPQKVIAYELGRTEALVSVSLRRAMRKLGVSSRASLIELHGALVGS